ncbi:MAG: tail fiber domain-containing protein [Stellaceae bacterium]
MRLKLISVVAAAALAACTMNQQTTSGGFCDRNPVVCALIGAAVFGGVAAAIATGTHDNHGSHVIAVSDARLKTYIRAVGRLDNGMRLYAYRYRGDDRIFVGPIAQDLLADARFRHAVSVDAKGYYRVDLTALDLDVINGATMMAAGERAELSVGTTH